MITIYLITNKNNGKYYVGQTSQRATVRLKNHINSAKIGRGCKRLRNSIIKHGSEAFVIQELATAKDDKEANSLESLWIWALNSTNESVGYNLSVGGKAPRGFKWDKESREKLSKTNLGNKHSKGIECSSEKKQKISLSLKGHVVSEETKAKIREKRALQTNVVGAKGPRGPQKNPHRNKVLQHA
jgi:group I intron endonuclease